jgi:hypothetical protein
MVDETWNPDDTHFELEMAIALAFNAHAKQVDKSGDPYILHPLRVMQKAYETDPRLAPAAVLHDVIEDTDQTASNLQSLGMSLGTVGLVVCLTHLPGEPRFDYIERIRTEPGAVVIKRFDIADNQTRLWKLDVETQRRLHDKYNADMLQLRTGQRA